MKKNLSVVFGFVMMMLLVACGNAEEDPIVLGPYSTVQPQLQTQEASQIQEPQIQETPQVQQQQTQENYFFNDLNNAYDLNNVSVKPRYMYWDNGSLVAECFVINGLDTAVYNVNVNNLEFSNGAGVFASASFGTLQGASIAPYSYIVWTFTFPADCVYKTNADLTGNINTSANTNYNY